MKLKDGIWTGSLGNTVVIPNVYAEGGLIARSKGSLTKERVMNDVRMTLTKQNSFEFAGCIMVANMIKYINSAFKFYSLDNNLYFNNIVKMVKECQLLDTVGERGKRDIIFRGKNIVFSGRDLSFENSLLFYFHLGLISSIGSSGKNCTVTIPPFTSSDFSAPSYATHVRFLFNLMLLSKFSFNDEDMRYNEVTGIKNASQVASSYYYDLSVGNAVSTPLTWYLPAGLPSAPATTASLLFGSCVFYEYDGTDYNRISGYDNVQLLKLR